MEPGELQDLSHAISAHTHYLRLAFRRRVADAVQLGWLLADMDREGVPAAAAGISPWRERMYRTAARRFYDYEGWTEAEWLAAEEKENQAGEQWLRLIDKKLPPRKRERARRLLRTNPFAMLAAALIFREKE